MLETDPPGADLYQVYQHLRSVDPSCLDTKDQRLWLLTRHDSVAWALTDSRLLSQGQHSIQKLVGKSENLEAAQLPLALFEHQLEVMNGPSHRRTRMLIGRALSKISTRHVEQLVRQRFGASISRLATSGEVDFARDLSANLPKDVFLDLLGLTDDARADFSGWMEDLLRLLGDDEVTVQQLHNAETSASQFVDLVSRLTAEYRRVPADNLISHLAGVEQGGDQLTVTEIAANVMLLFAAGSGTVASLLSTALYTLLCRRAALAALRAAPATVPAVVEECLRFESPIQSVSRVASCDIKIGQASIRSTDRVMLVIGSANRDSARFPLADQFAPRRETGAHLAFGKGSHYCVGAKIARAQVSAVLSTLIERAPELSLSHRHPEWLEGLTYRGLRSLPISWRVKRLSATE